MKPILEYLLGKNNKTVKRGEVEITDSETWEVGDVLYGLFDDGDEGLEPRFFKILDIAGDEFTLQEYASKKVASWKHTLSDNEIGGPVKAKLNKRKNIVFQGEWLRYWDGKPVDA